MKQCIRQPWFLAALMIVLVGAFLRLYRLESTMMFQGDQGRDAIVVKRIVKDGDLTLLGPVTSVGNMYLGPFYYYFMAPWLALSYPNPVGPAIGVALVGIITLAGVIWFAKKSSTKTNAIISGVLYALMGTAVIYSRFSWNPNIAPFFSLLSVFFLYKMLKKENPFYLIAATVSYAVLAQLHYIALLMGGTLGIVWVYALISWKQKRIKSLLAGLASFFVFALSFAPLIAFDLRHERIISQGFETFLTGEEQHLQPVSRLLTVVKELEGKSFKVLAQLIGSPNGIADRIITYGSLFVLFAYLWWQERAKWSTGILLTLAWLLPGIIGISFYTSTVFTHYISYLFPAVALYFGFLLTFLWNKHIIGKGIAAAFTAAFLYWNIPVIADTVTAQMGTKIYESTAQAAYSLIDSDNYNLALLSESKDYKGFNYRYFLEISDKPPRGIDEYFELDQLIIVDEQQTDDPLIQSIFEISAPQVSTISAEKKIENGPRVLLAE